MWKMMREERWATKATLEYTISKWRRDHDHDHDQMRHLVLLGFGRCICQSDSRFYIILNICPDHVLRALDYARTLVQQCTRRFAVREYRDTAHDRLDWVRVDNTLFHTRDEEGGLAAAEVIVQVD